MSRPWNLIIVSLLNLFFVSCANSDTLIVKLSKEAEAKPSTVSVEILVINHTDTTVKFPKPGYFSVGHKGDFLGDCYFEIFEIKEGAEINVTSNHDIGYDMGPHEYKELRKGETIKYIFELGDRFDLEDGKKYKARVVLKSKNLKLSEDVASEWITL